MSPSGVIEEAHVCICTHLSCAESADRLVECTNNVALTAAMHSKCNSDMTSAVVRGTHYRDNVLWVSDDGASKSDLLPLSFPTPLKE